AGVLQVVTDPRMTLTQGLEAMLVAELADTDGWLVLADLAERLDQFDMADEFRRALAEEEDHVARIRQWVSNAVVGQAGIEPTPRIHEPESPRP
ncbi:MAG TPA: hypothetical protein VKZ63_04715, partial [Kofleriaceae bacterium]|nr:hypothetical protein [Kofleriaceae bacterium]